MLLTNLKIPNSINTSDNDVSQDFFIPLLKTSTTYDRGVGYFSSGWLKINSLGLADFASKNGKARWITSPILAEDDWEALKTGTEARQDEILKEALAKNINDLQESLTSDTLSALAWMVADGLLEFRLAITRGKLDGDFHDKFGIFTDVEGNQVSFSGSYNESVQGTRNYDAFKVFKSWIPAHQDWVADDVHRFNKLWNNQDPNIRVLDIGGSNKENIIRLRAYKRPYHGSTAKIEVESNEEDTSSLETPSPSQPEIRPYQQEAITAWFNNNCQGFIEMATGTGKTFTSLAASKRLLERESRLALIIAVPYQHLVDQWKEEASKFGYTSILAYKSKSLWINRLNTSIIEYNNNYRKFLCVITTHDTFASQDFQATIARIQKPALLIADEAHHLGSETAQKAYPYNVPYRLALSATPDRWYDDAGTAALRTYFGKTVFEFTLGQAIGVSLTPYYYYPVLVDLIPSEVNKYSELSIKIARLSGKDRSQKEEDSLKILLLKRAEILNKAANKLIILSDLLDQNPVEKHTLFYCAPGQIDDVVELVGGRKGYLIHTFTSQEDNAFRKQLLTDFAKGHLQALAAIKCLDEGVDVPNTETAYLLASTSNPREFIQRRGRILRRAPGKECSYLYDLITIPPNLNGRVGDNPLFKIERSIIKKELDRFKEFADYAQNKHQAIDIIWSIAKHYHLTDF